MSMLDSNLVERKKIAIIDLFLLMIDTQVSVDVCNI